MAGELRIGVPYTRSINGSKTRLYAVIDLDGETTELWYEVDAEYGKYLCEERSDAFVVNLLLYSMEHELNIVCDASVSERLYYQLTEYLIPAIATNIQRYKAIRITADTDDAVMSIENAVGGSLSGGVDSFYTLFRHTDKEVESFNITHLTFFNAGASGSFGGDQARKLFRDRAEWMHGIALDLGMPLICVDTNINEFLCEDHEATHTFRTLAIPLALQKLFRRYYFASGVAYRDFGFTEHDTAYYDLLNVQMLSTESITFYSSGAEATRLEKIAFISSFELTSSKLNVCVSQDMNCSKCEKCQRTMVEIDVLGKSEVYRDVFDWEYYNAHKRKYYSTAVLHKSGSDWGDVYRILKKRGLMTLDIRIYAFLRKAKRRLSRMVN